MQLRVDTLKNKFELLDQLKALDNKSWPIFLQNGDLLSWSRIYHELSDFVLLWVDTEERLAGAGFTIPTTWNGELDDLPGTMEAIIQSGLNLQSQQPSTLMAVAALVDREFRGLGLSAEILKNMAGLARRHGIGDLVVPVRPTWKTRYPLQSIEHYASWRRADGLFYDPWLRTHQRLGAKCLKCVESTLKVEGSIAQWQSWTGMIFPESGSYVVDGALQPVVMDVQADKGIYHDPNVWMRHVVTGT